MAMGNMIAPGVYTRIIDLSEYLADVPGTVAFCPIICRKGPDNKLVFQSGRNEFLNRFGEPNILDYGKAYGQGPYVVANHMSVASSMYVMRCLPEDATFSHMIIGVQTVRDTISATISSSSLENALDHLQLYPLFMDGEWHVTGKAYADTAGSKLLTDWTLPEDLEEYPPNETYYLEDGTPTTMPEHPTNHDLATIKVAATKNLAGAAGWGWAIKYPSINSVKELDSFIQEYADGAGGSTADIMYIQSTGGVGLPDGILCYFHGLGRGDAYNDYSIRITKSANSQMFGVYNLDIYETQSDGDDVIIESFNVSWDPFMVDESGESLFIEDVVNRYSKDIRCTVNRKALEALNSGVTIDGVSLTSPMMDFYKNDPTLPEPYDKLYQTKDEHGFLVGDLGYKATMIELAKGDYDYYLAELNKYIDVLTAARALPTTSMSQIQTRNTAIRSAIDLVTEHRGYVNTAKVNLENAYNLDMLTLADANDETAAWDPVRLRYGSEGSLSYLDRNTGKRVVDAHTATETLSKAYQGLLKRADIHLREDVRYKVQYADEVLDLDWIYFSLVYEAGYPMDVKESARTLCDELRRDCMLISDVTDLVDLEDTLNYVGASVYTENADAAMWTSRYAARFNPYSRIYDTYTGRDVWMSPVYHMAQIIPKTDMLYELWYAPAGFNRATVDEIKELRWNPKQGEREQLYLNQINPIVRFSAGYTVFSQLTTQKRPSALQDINCMRLVLYIKRALEQYLKYFIFEFNDSETWDRIKQGMIPFLDTIKSKRGLKSYNIEVGATDYEFKQKICHVNVTLEPMRVIEKIELNLFIK